MEREYRMLLDERQIRDVIGRYCHTMDYGRHDEWLGCFTDDAIYDVLLPDGSLYARVEGREALGKFVSGFPRPGLHKHVYAMPQIEVDPDAGTATVEISFFMLSAEGRGVEVSAFGRSSDRMVRTEAGWKFRERRIVTEVMTLPSE